jgi:hypothetical protein
MKREDEIEKASDKYIEDYLKSSNEYPLCDNRKRMSLIQVDLYKMQEAFENGMKEADKTMLDRACEWLKNGGYFVNSNETIEDFRKAMEGGAE